ncbi:distant relative of homeotic protein bithoraxoid [Methanocella sp. CWC-04]|uniref:Distant relative of homeotic protein bithoraxoid n=1 Tax=Methanooceanicella nereidis TaxID=2052831 RepID=A0AAP2W4M6_9EURY|nr:roadblock/LC7 domain-containing protein [Methanocella sp. CWC-04]MCD1294480.1 distant relative of homeotic protein bithoraxoid [Methanocella sp. CWC-04]
MAGAIEKLDKVLNDLRGSGDIKALAIVSRDGLLITSNMPGDVHAETFAIMAATMLGAAETATLEMNQGVPDRLIVETDESKLVIMGAGERAMLVLIAGSRAGLGSIIVEMDNAIAKIRDILSENKK